MNNKLTIIVENIPDGAIDELWRYAKKTAKKEVGFQLRQTDKITIDFEFMMLAYPKDSEVLSELFAAAITAHLAMEADKILNP